MLFLENLGWYQEKLRIFVISINELTDSTWLFLTMLDWVFNEWNVLHNCISYTVVSNLFITSLPHAFHVQIIPTETDTASSEDLSWVACMPQRFAWNDILPHRILGEPASSSKLLDFKIQHFFLFRNMEIISPLLRANTRINWWMFQPVLDLCIKYLCGICESRKWGNFIPN